MYCKSYYHILKSLLKYKLLLNLIVHVILAISYVINFSCHVTFFCENDYKEDIWIIDYQIMSKGLYIRRCGQKIIQPIELYLKYHV